MRDRGRSFALACAVAATLCGGAAAAAAHEATAARTETRWKLAGLPLADALRELGDAGVTVLFTAEVVQPEMTVVEEPRSSDPRRALDEILAPHGLIARQGPGGLVLIVAAPVTRPASVQCEVLAFGGAGEAAGPVRLRIGGRDEIQVGWGETFDATELAPGRYAIEASADGFLTQRLDVDLAEGASRRVVFHLQRQPFLEEEIVVRPSRLSLLEDRPASAFSMSRDDLDRLPHLGGDLLRAASLLPGTSANDVTAQLSVHGGRRDEVQILLDGQELYEAFHLKDYDNALSLVPATALEGATLTTGAYAASYGDRMSGVLDLRTAEPGSGRRYLLSASVLDLVANASGSWGGAGPSPIGVGGPGERAGGWLLSGRRGSIDLASEFLGNEDPSFWDLLGKAEVSTPAGRFTARALISGDELELDKPEEESFELIENDYENRYAWMTHEGHLGDRFLIETTASFANVRRDRAGAASEEKGDFEVDDRRDLDVAGLVQTMTWDGGGHLLRGGWEVRRYDASFDYAKHIDPEVTILAPFSPTQPTDSAFDGVVRGDHAGAWASDRLQLFEKLSAELGLRWDHHEATGDTLWSPRLNLAWRLDETSVVRASWGRFFQSQRPYELQVEDAETTLFEAELTEHSVLGYEAIFAGGGPGLEGVRVEIFRRDVDDPRPRFENLLQPLEFLPEVEPDRVQITPVSSKAEGVEVLVRARGDERLGAWLGYTYSRARDRIARDRVPRSLDQPHAGTLGLDFRASERTSLAVAWRYRSGWPTTPVSGVPLPDPEDPDELETQLVFGRLNSERLGAYHRLDLRASHRVPLRRGSLLLFLDVQNAYDRANDAGFDMSIDDETDEVISERETWPGIFPSLGVVWEF
jgi:outer membrane receptor protein involved in Fe transport